MSNFSGTSCVVTTMGMGSVSKSEDTGEMRVSGRIFSRWIVFFLPCSRVPSKNSENLPKTVKKLKSFESFFLFSGIHFDDGFRRLVVFRGLNFSFSFLPRIGWQFDERLILLVNFQTSFHESAPCKSHKGGGDRSRRDRKHFNLCKVKLCGPRERRFLFTCRPFLSWGDFRCFWSNFLEIAPKITLP